MNSTGNIILGNYTIDVNSDKISKMSNQTVEKKAISNNTEEIGVVLTLSNETMVERFSSADGTVYAKGAAKKTVLKLGSKGSRVKDLQKNLTKLGYSTNGVDGIFGKGTQKAVLAFQKAYGLKADGVVGAATTKAINKALDYQKKGILTEGSRGRKVKELQKNLTKLGYSTKGTDGIFGKGTKKAVLAFQKAHGLTADGIVGTKTQKAIEKALKNKKTNKTKESNYIPASNSKKIQRMLNNLKNDTSLGLTKEKKTAMLMAAERLLNDNYKLAFVAGVLGNIQNEGNVGQFESSNYKSNPSMEPSYLKYMDAHCNYRSRFSGKSIRDVGISAALQLQKQARASGYSGKFGLGMIQWTGKRTEGLLKSYQKYAKSDKPTMNECIMAEVNYMADELKGEFSKVYTSWKAGNKTAENAGRIFCDQYENPANKSREMKRRGNNASKIYEIMRK